MRVMAMLLLVVPMISAQDTPVPVPVALDLAAEDLPTLLTFEIDKKGALRLKRDHWEAAVADPNAAAKPEPKLPENMDAAQAAQVRMMMRINRKDPPMHTLLSRIMTKAGARNRGRGMSGTASDGDFRGDNAAAAYRTNGDWLTIFMSEFAGRARAIQIEDDEKETRFTVSSPAGFVRIRRTSEGVHVCSAVDGKVNSVTARSFTELVHGHPEYFKDTIVPATRGIAVLPIDAALELLAKENNDRPQFLPKEFPSGPLTEDKVKLALAPLVQFRMVDGRPRFNRDAGDEGLFDREVEGLKKAYATLLEESVARLQANGGSVYLIGKLRREMGLAGDVPAGRGAFARAMPKGPELQLFEHFQTMAGGRTGGGFSGGSNGSFSREFGDDRHDKGGIGGRILGGPSLNELEVKDSDVRIRMTDSENLTRIHCDSATGSVLFCQTDDPPMCSIAIIGGGKATWLTGKSYVSMLSTKRVSFRRDAALVWARYGLGGLDPFDRDTVAALLEALKTPEKTQALVSSLIDDDEYLTALADRLGEDKDVSLIRERIALLKSDD